MEVDQKVGTPGDIKRTLRMNEPAKTGRKIKESGGEKKGL